MPREYEIHPCKYIGKPYTINGKSIRDMEQCEPGDPDLVCWSVFEHLQPTGKHKEFGGLECLRDCETEQEADEFAKAISLIPDNFRILRDDEIMQKGDMVRHIDGFGQDWMITGLSGDPVDSLTTKKYSIVYRDENAVQR